MLIELTCPSCGGNLELTDDLDIAYCMYCGTKIIVSKPDEAKKIEKIKNYEVLLERAVDAKFYAEALIYCNKILEINSDNIEALMNKAIATFFTMKDDEFQFNKAMRYLESAEKIYPSNNRITDVRKMFEEKHFDKLKELGDQSFDKAIKNDTVSRRFRWGASIPTESIAFPYYQKAMTYYSNAINLKNTDDHILKKIIDITRFTGRKLWGITKQQEKYIKITIERNEKLAYIKKEIHVLEEKTNTKNPSQWEINKLEVKNNELTEFEKFLDEEGYEFKFTQI